MNRKRQFAPLFPMPVEHMSDDCLTPLFRARDAWSARIVRERSLPPRKRGDEVILLPDAASRWVFMVAWQNEPRDQFAGIEHELEPF